MPTLELRQDGAFVKDTYINNNNSSNFGNASELFIGYYGATAERTWFYFQPDLSRIPTGIEIKSASLVFKWKERNNYASNETIEAYRIVDDWVETEPRYYGINHPPTTENPVSYVTSYNYNGDLIFSDSGLKNLVQDWIDGVYPNYGIMVDKSSSFVNKVTLYSSDILDESKRPVLIVTYNEAPTSPIVTSPNGGETWKDAHTIQWNAATDPEGSSLRYQIQLSTDNGSTWSNIVSLTSPGVTSYPYDFSNVPDTSLAKIRIRAYDGELYSEWDESDGVFTIKHNVAPLIPSNLNPNGGIVDRTIVQRLSWKHNDDNVQGKALIEWKLQNGVSWNTVEVNSSNQYNDFSPGFFPAGTIVWRVKTFDQYSLESPYSDIIAFESVEPTNAPVISPISAAVSRPTVQWSSLGQIAYQIIVTDSNNNTIWDTGEVTSTNKARTVGVSFENGGTYTVKVRVKDATNLWSDYESQTITVSYTPPAKPIIGVNKADGHLVIDIHNPVPTGTQPSVIGNDVFKKIDGNWVMIAENIFYQYRDYEVGSGKAYEYMVTAHGDNETSTSSTSAIGSVKLHGVWLHQITDPEASVYHFKYDGGGRASQWEVESSRMMFKGRKYPVIETGEMHNDLVSFSLTLTSEDERIALENLVYSHSMLCYRDGRGRLVVGMITRLPLEDEIWGGQTTSLEIIRVDYKEGV
jgi:hypothetical protein